jgi:hypothetical protein
MEPRTDPRELLRDARRLLTVLHDGALDEDGPEHIRQRFLAAQLTALECTARRLTGEVVPFRAEIASCFEIEITAPPTDRYAAVHDAISELLGGSGLLRPRLERAYHRNSVPPHKLLRCVQAVSDELRPEVRAMFGLPENEQVTYRIVRDVPWNAFNRYLGGFRSEVALNARSGRNIAALPVMVTHESYGGHHTEQCLKEAGLALGRGQEEQTIALVNTPQCLMREGAAELALDVVLGEGWGPWTADVLAGHGVHVDGALVEQLLMLIRQLLPVRLEALLMAHEQRADVEAVILHLERWLLLPRERAEHMVAFLLDPLWRAYAVTYVEGARLVGAWLAARPAGETATQRYDTLLRRALTPSALQAELATGPAGVRDRPWSPTRPR